MSSKKGTKALKSPPGSPPPNGKWEYQLDFEYEDLARAARHLRIIQTVYEYEDMMDKYVELFRSLDAQDLQQLNDLCASVNRTGGTVAHPDGSVTAVYEKALLTFPDFKLLMARIADDNHATLQMGPIKKPDRVMQKATDDYKGDCSRVIDIVRASISFPDLSSLVNALHSLNQDKGVRILRVKNGFTGSLKFGGYSDVKINLSLNNHVCELQLHLASFLHLKDHGGHEIYESTRQFPIPGATAINDLISDKTPQSTKVLRNLVKFNLEVTKLETDQNLNNPKFLAAERALCSFASRTESSLREWVARVGDSDNATQSQKNNAKLLLANYLNDALKFKDAKDICMEVIAEMEETWSQLGTTVPDRILTKAREVHVKVLKESGKYMEALAEVEKVIDDMKMLFGEKHPDTIRILGIKGILYRELGNYDEAAQCHLDCLTMFEEIASKNSESLGISACCNDLGLDLKMKGDLDEAIKYYERSLAIKIKILGKNSVSVAISYNNIGMISKTKGDLDGALAYFEKSLAIKLKTLGEDDKDVAVSYTNIGLIYKQKGNLDEAVKYYTRSMNIKIKTLGEEHPDLALAYNNLGLALKEKGDNKEALQYLEKSLAIKLKTLGEDHPTVGPLKKSIQSLKK